MLPPYSPDIIWLVCVAFVIAFVLAFGIGANDVANSFGTSVGAKVLTIRQACWMATVCELAGAVLIGYKVSDTMRKSILDSAVYVDDEKSLMLGCTAALAASAAWLLVATWLKLPISGTHSIVGATVGFSLVAKGFRGLQWAALGRIIGSWFVSPVLSGVMSVVLFWGIKRWILQARNPLQAGLWALPVFYAVTFAVNVFSIVYKGPKLLHLDGISAPVAISISVGVGLAIGALVQWLVVPWQRRKVLGQSKASGKPVKFTIDGGEDATPSGSPTKRPKTSRPNSLIVADGAASDKLLPAITETTELVAFRADQPSIGNGDQHHQHLNHGDPALLRNLIVGDLSAQLTNSIAAAKDAAASTAAADPPTSAGTNAHQFSPNMVERAERLLGKASLDNTDLTITSLNYIDEQHNGAAATARNGAIQSYFDRHSQPRSPVVNGTTNGATNGTAVVATTGVVAVCSPDTATGDCPSSSEADTLPVADLPRDPAAAAAVAEPNRTKETLASNSSKVPLIGCSRTDTSATAALALVDEPEDVSTLFSFLQVLTAAFGSFAHGGNDVSNAIGPLIAIWMIFVDGTLAKESETPLWILVFGGAGISVGLWVWGRRVIETVGNDLTTITPSTGFTIEIGAAMTVLLASNFGLPVSTTHCKVGSVVFVGYSNAHRYTAAELAAGLPQIKAVDWALFRNIVYAWVVTVPVAALLSAAIMWVLMAVAL